MPTVRDVLNEVENLAPSRYAFSFDPVGLQTGEPNVQVTGIVVSLDCSNGAVDFALASGSNVIVAHHPVVWDPLKTVRTDDAKGALVSRLVGSGIAVIGAHTNWDCALGGVNDTLASLLGLTCVRPFGSRSDSKAFKLVTFAPKMATEAIIDALSEAGAGRIGLYDRCAFVSEGTGTFRGNEGARPVVGTVGRIENVAENRIEMVVSTVQLGSALAALRQSHPYEEPAYDIVPLESGNGFPIGRVGSLPSPMSPKSFVEQVSQNLGTTTLSWGGSQESIKDVAVVGGAADGEWSAAIEAGVQAFVTGEVKHHIALEASDCGLLVVQAGHYATEHPGAVALQNALAAALPAVKVEVYEPEPGQFGRPY